LGVLYEILTFRPPFDGTTGVNVIAKVLLGDLTPPSARVSEIRKAVADARKGEEIMFPESVPADLETIILNAMAREKKDRYASARELHGEVQGFLEGEKEKTRNHDRALAKVAEGKALVERTERARVDLKISEKEVEVKTNEIKPHWPVEKREELWAAEDKAMDLQRQIVDHFTGAGAAFQTALEFERGNKEARAALADLYWAQFLREEEAGDYAEMRRNEKLVRHYNDGQYDARLKGDGTLAVSTRAFPCSCLTDGRMVKPGEMAIMGFHPFSGRALDGHEGAEGLPNLEPTVPIRLKVHGPECRTEPLEGADVWLFRYEKRKKILVPVFPEGAGMKGAIRQAVPDAILDRCFDRCSPFRPAEGLYIGRTPVARLDLPMGSYLLILHREGFLPVRRPVHIGRLADEEANVTLSREDDVLPGFIYVPGGKFTYQGDKGNKYSGPKEIRETEDFLIAKFP